ncbi:MAG: dihydrofolate reductase (trimethoprim resistance protein) [Paraglaciecola psychrophila]
MKLSLMAAVSRNGVIGNGADIPWQAKGEQLLFKAMTYNQWLLVGRKTFESMGLLPNRRYVVISRSGQYQVDDERVKVFSSVDSALAELPQFTDHLMVAGGGEIYRQLIDRVDTVHRSVVEVEASGDITFPKLPADLEQVFEQRFESNVEYCYQIWKKRRS